LTEESLNSLTRENKQGTASNHDKEQTNKARHQQGIHGINKRNNREKQEEQQRNSKEQRKETRGTTERNKGPLAGRHMVFLIV
jgi:hypothetical protein